MKRNKIIFYVLSGIFLIIMFYFVVDFSRKTNFPGSGKDNESIDSLEISSQP